MEGKTIALDESGRNEDTSPRFRVEDRNSDTVRRMFVPLER